MLQRKATLEKNKSHLKEFVVCSSAFGVKGSAIELILDIASRQM
jgi:hypothetical protein